MSESGIYAVYSALAINQIMQATDCTREIASLEFEEASKPFVGKQLGVEDLLDMVTNATDLVRARKMFER